MKLLTEITYDDVDCISEATENGRKLYITGPFLAGDIVNRNNRKYPMDVLRKEVSRYVKEKIETRDALGELNHPNSPNINYERASHKILSLTEDGKHFIGKAVILNTPMGNIVKALHEEDVRIGVSSRALGSLRMTQEGYNLVQNDFRLATAADIVSDPSGPGCYVDGLMENVDWIYNEQQNSWQAVQLATEQKQYVAKNYKNLTESQKLLLFNDFLSNLR